MPIFVELFDDDPYGNPLPFLHEDDGRSPALPNEVSNLHLGFPDSLFDNFGEDFECNDLTTILQRRKTKFDEILLSIGQHEVGTEPEYYAMLSAAIQKTDTFSISMRNEMGFPLDGLFFCLMNNLMLPNGLKQLELDLLPPNNILSTQQAKLLLQGLAHSSCLESLHLPNFVCEDPVLVTEALVNALQENRSLKDFCFNPDHYQDSEAVFRVAVQDTKVESISTSFFGEVDLRVVLDSLSFEGCQVRSLRTRFSNRLIADGPFSSTTVNTSVHKVSLSYAELHHSHLTCICSFFQSLTELNLEGNHLQDLSPLHPLLVGDSRTLQRLCLGRCGIEEITIIELFRLLPQMKCIRCIELHENAFLEFRDWTDVLSESIQQNTSLEELRFSRHRLSSGERGLFYSRLEQSLGTNRAWRRYMENGHRMTEEAYNSNLWPSVLERATKMPYSACSGDKRDTNHLPGLQRDVVFWLLRERMDWAHLASNPTSSSEASTPVQQV